VWFPARMCPVDFCTTMGRYCPWAFRDSMTDPMSPCLTFCGWLVMLVMGIVSWFMGTTVIVGAYDLVSPNDVSVVCVCSIPPFSGASHGALVVLLVFACSVALVANTDCAVAEYIFAVATAFVAGTVWCWCET